VYRQRGYPRGEAWALDGLGVVHTRLDQPEQAVAFHQQALAFFRKSGERASEAGALNGLAEASLAAGQPTDALLQHTTALNTSTMPSQQARAHTGIGHAHRVLGDTALARLKRIRHGRHPPAMRPGAVQREDRGLSLKIRMPRYLFSHACLCGWRRAASSPSWGSMAVSIHSPAVLITLSRSDMV
jgi:hypothetical protein